MLRRVGAIGDVHCEHERLSQAIAAFAELGVDQLIAVGDIADGVGDVDRCCALLREHGVACVRGNHDRWLLHGELRSLPHANQQLSDSVRAYLQQLPPTLTFETVAGRMLLCHGLGDNDMAKLTADDFGYALETNDALQRILTSRLFSVVVNGHTHRPLVRTLDDVTFINVGTLARDHEPSFSLIDFAAGSCERYDVTETSWRLRARSPLR
jgi:putative phosphoesterase